ncbi:phosphoadenylyl-sulfate reductase [Kutzneria buriramensis]|uniref:Adenosine 5'-phosphosulfate reductase n=1 Tax=Kutzneria buriramensis TaxID=1045776 RepID=A0A3E0GX79_9PSEU|nr:phosphoadenylyl-sulfate reductase [Kutzneria buriramensis]REH33002.1 phosphoadenosine phosphosulfate reductase [Kutzneria buriramensis]
MDARPRAEIRRIADTAAAQLRDATAEDILSWAGRTFGDRLAVASSMADTVLVDLAARHAPGVHVLFLDTGYHFPETIGTRDAMAAIYPITLVTVTPEQTVAEQDRSYGPRLYTRDPDKCCALRKVAPLDAALEHYDAWVTGLRREDSPTRADTPVIGWDERHGMVKINPLAGWTAEDVAEHAARHGVLQNPLLADGYLSVGCRPCTTRVTPGADPRSGRWLGLVKTECGLHG